MQPEYNDDQGYVARRTFAGSSIEKPYIFEGVLVFIQPGQHPAGDELMATKSLKEARIWPVNG
jgi:hypothetical protein